MEFIIYLPNKPLWCQFSFVCFLLFLCMSYPSSLLFPFSFSLFIRTLSHLLEHLFVYPSYSSPSPVRINNHPPHQCPHFRLVILFFSGNAGCLLIDAIVSGFFPLPHPLADESMTLNPRFDPFGCRVCFFAAGCLHGGTPRACFNPIFCSLRRIGVSPFHPPPPNHPYCCSQYPHLQHLSPLCPYPLLYVRFDHSDVFEHPRFRFSGNVGTFWICCLSLLPPCPSYPFVPRTLTIASDHTIHFWAVLFF